MSNFRKPGGLVFHRDAPPITRIPHSSWLVEKVSQPSPPPDRRCPCRAIYF